MGYFLTTRAENAVPGNSLARPKTHTPGSRVSNLGQRFYCPGLGRWINRDPIGEDGGLSIYVYTANRLVSSIDPVGLSLTWENETCSGCNAGPGGVHDGWTGGGLKKCLDSPPIWESGGAVHFSHDCALRGNSRAGRTSTLCNTETHVRMRVTNEKPCCCTLFAVECRVTYSGRAFAKNKAVVYLKVNFLGTWSSYTGRQSFDPPPPAYSGNEEDGPFNAAFGSDLLFAGNVAVPCGGTANVITALPVALSQKGAPGGLDESLKVVCAHRCASTGSDSE